MIKRRLVALVYCLLGSILLVLSLHYISNQVRHSRNSFIRLLPSHIVLPGNILDLRRSGWRFSGISDDSLYLGNFYVPDKILKVSKDIKDTISVKLNFPNNVKLTQTYFNSVDNGSVYTFDGSQPALFKSNLINGQLKIKAKPPFFTQAIHSCNNSYVLRVVLNGQNTLVNYNSDSTGLRIPIGLLEKQVDGVFCTVGNLIKVPNSNRIFYIYYYRNQFICADKKLTLLYKGKTIDTVSKAKIKVAYIKSQNQTTLAIPPVYVNKQSTANDKYLFIRSGLKADNEVGGTLDKLSVIDVYQVTDGRYKFSFYLPDFNGKKLTDFRAYGKNLYALYDHYLYKYQLNF